jgi:hypothetical protein
MFPLHCWQKGQGDEWFIAVVLLSPSEVAAFLLGFAPSEVDASLMDLAPLDLPQGSVHFFGGVCQAFVFVLVAQQFERFGQVV